MKNDATITFRLPSSEKAAMESQADAAGVSLGDWIRARCNGPAETVASVPTVYEGATRWHLAHMAALGLSPACKVKDCPQCLAEKSTGG